MSFFDLDPAATQNVMDQARLNPLDPATLKPGWFAGAWKAPVTGMASAFNDAALLMGDAATPALRAAARPVDDLFNTKLDDWVTKQQQIPVENIKEWAPDPRTTGVIGQAVHGLFNVVPEVLAGGPETAAVLQGYKGFRGGMAEGLDPTTAFSKGAIEGLSTWVGLKLPMSLGPTAGAVKNIGFGAAANVPVGMVQRGATGALLEARGYHDMASQYQALDSAALATDLIMGAGFGAVAHYGPGALAKYEAWRKDHKGKIMPSDVDTALGLNNQLHLELDTAPGIPTDPATRAAHVEAVHTAIQDLLAGDPVTTDAAVTRGEFIENPSAVKTREQIVQVVEDHMGPEWKVFEAQLRERGLPLDDIDQTGTVKVVKKEPVFQPVELEDSQNKKAQGLRAEFDNGDGSKGVLDLIIKDGRMHPSWVDNGIYKNTDSGSSGAVTSIYEKAIAEAKSRGLEFTSDDSVTIGAARVYEALGRRGYAITKNPKARLAKSPEVLTDRLMTDDGSPVFQVGDKQAGPTDTIGRILNERTDMTIPSGDGQTLPARDALAQSDAEIASAKRDAQGYEAAVACALRG
jgi:hypothetical protein